MATYYISTTDGNDARTTIQAQNQATPWKTVGRLNSAAVVQPGDTVLLRAGDTFTDALTMVSGTSAQRVTFTRYGTGPNPVLSGYTTLSGWAFSGGNIYYVPFDVAHLNAVTVDGEIKAMGRFPKTGYLTHETHVGNSSITDTSLTGSPSYTGGEVVIRKFRWILDRHRITNHSGSTINYSADNFWGNNQTLPIAGNGYFIQNHISTLTQDGEWAYNKTEKRLYMYFAGGHAGRVVKAAGREFVAIINAQSFINFAAVDFEGGNYAVYMDNNTNNINFINCNFKKHGANAVYALNSNGVTFQGGSLTDCLNSGLQIEGCNDFIISGTSIDKAGAIAGMGQSGDGSYQGIRATSNDINITRCRITNTGYCPIYFIGDNIQIERNFIDYHGFVKDDSGGIYTYNLHNGATYNNRIIRNNIILRAIGAVAGTAGDLNAENFGKACSIYLDDYSNGTRVENNYCERSDWAGLFMHNSYNNQIIDNQTFDTANGLFILQEGTDTRNNVFTNNQWIAKTATQRTMLIQMEVADNPALFGTFNNNFYARPIAEGNTIGIDRRYSGGMSSISLSSWKTTYGRDPQSAVSQVSVTSEGQLQGYYNDAEASATVPIPAVYKDVTGATYSNSLSLPGYDSEVLAYFEPAAPVTPGVEKILVMDGFILTENGKILTVID